MRNNSGHSATVHATRTRTGAHGFKRTSDLHSSTPDNSAKMLINRKKSTFKDGDFSITTDVDPEPNLRLDVLGNVQNVSIKDSSVTFTTHINNGSKRPLDILYRHVSTHAILNEGGRADDAKCEIGTREKVIDRIEWWMNDIDSERIHWLKAPMGGGKTAIMKTIEERAAAREAQTINFFFFRGDATRNRLQPVFPTLLYQLCHIDTSLKEAIQRIMSTRPLLLDESISKQCEVIITLFPTIRPLFPPGNEIVLLIDGLDECYADTEAHKAQGDILSALKGLVVANDSPFRLLVASRAEPHIQMAFNSLLTEVQTTFLDKEYNPDDDIRKVVARGFDKIKRTHPCAFSIPPDWPSSSDVESIVSQSSGQFIYAATVMRYLATPTSDPVLSLQRVQGIVPASNSPFQQLDSIYELILAQVPGEDRNATGDILSIDTLLKGLNLDHSIYLSVVDILPLYNPFYSQSTASVIEASIAALSAIVELAPTGYLRYYHASTTEFLVDQTRSGEYCLDLASFRPKLLLALWNRAGIQDSSIVLNLQINLFNELGEPTPEITDRLLNMPLPEWMVPTGTWKKFGDPGRILLEDVRYLYYGKDMEVYKLILDRFVYMLWSRGWRGRVANVPYAEDYFVFYQMFGWWFKLSERLHKKKAKTGRKALSNTPS